MQEIHAHDLCTAYLMGLTESMQNIKRQDNSASSPLKKTHAYAGHIFYYVINIVFPRFDHAGLMTSSFLRAPL